MAENQNIVQKKKEMRGFMKNQLSDLQKRPDLFQQESESACKRFLESQLYSECEVLFAFVSLKNEINTNLILQTALTQGKNVAVPRVVSDTEMEFFFLQNRPLEQQLVSGAFGILEPAAFLSKAEPSEIFSGKKLMLLPGLAFSPDGFRLGKGRGYYDRYIARLKDVSLCGFSFSFQIMEQIPHDDFDKPVHHLCTEKGFIF